MDARSLVWTGGNIKEMTEFAEGANFRFSVGSPVDRYRWWHKAFNRATLWIPYCWLLQWHPKDDPSLLEVYPGATRSPDGSWTVARPGDAVSEDGAVGRGSRCL